MSTTSPRQMCYLYKNISLRLFPRTSFASLCILISMYSNKFHVTMILLIINVFFPTKTSRKILEEIFAMFTSGFQNRTNDDNSRETGELTYLNH